MTAPFKTKGKDLEWAMKKKIMAILVAVTCTMTLMAGCVKVVKIGEEDKLTGKTQFSASDSVSDMWDGAVENIAAKAVDLPIFLKEANGDLSSLADKYGKYSMGTSGSISYGVKGTGEVQEVNQEKKAGYMIVKLDGYDGSEIIKLQIGSIYKGSSTRDTLDIINFGDYTNQEEWAAISKQLHTMIDENVIKAADPSTLQGKSIDFVGTFTVGDNEELVITPVSLTAK